MNHLPAFPKRRPTVWRARFAAAVMAAALALGVGLQLQSAYDAAEVAAEILVKALVKAIAERVDGGVRAVDSLLNETAAAIQSGGRNDPVLAQRVLTRLEQFPEVHYIGVLSADGRLGPPTWPRINLPETGIDVSRQEYYKRLTAAKPPPPLAIGHPVSGRATERRSIHLVRPLTGPDGELNGAVIAAVNPDFWAKFLETVMVDPEGAAAVIHIDGRMVARAPDHEVKFAANIADSDLFKIWIPQNRVGIAHLIAKADGNDKIIAYRVLDNYPLVVTCGVSRHIAFADWRRMATLETFAALALLAVVFYWAWRSDRSATQMLAYGQRLETAVQARTSELAAARDAAGQTARRLQKVNVELQRMAMVTAHHLQEPLRPMVSYSQLLEQRLQGRDPDTDDMLAFIRNAAVRLKALLRDFQRYVAALTEEPDLQMVDSGQAAQASARAVARIFGDDALAVTWSDLPMVNADPALLRDLFRELLANAVAHRSHPGPAAVWIDCRADNDGWTFYVADDGPGIPPDLQERVFQVFETVTGRAADATGLGLPLCRLIVEAHGGDIAIEPSASGTVIRFRLPAVSPSPQQPQRRA